MKINTFFLVSLMSLTGCVLAPGMKMSEPPNVPGVKIVPITAELISEQRLKAKQTNIAGGKVAEVDRKVLGLIHVNGHTPTVNATSRQAAVPVLEQSDSASSRRGGGGANTVATHDSGAGFRRVVANSRSQANLSEVRSYNYRIGPRDILTITVWDHPELTIPAGEFRSAEAAGHVVAADGTIFYPHVGVVAVAGLTVDEVRKLLTRGIARTIVNPQLNVRVATYRSQRAFVVGQVASPGPQPITDVPLTVVKALDEAGDVTSDADKTQVTLTRNGIVTTIDLVALYQKGDLSQNLLLKNGDILHVPDLTSQRVFVMGEVASPAPVTLSDGTITLTEALSDAGGVDRVTSNPTRIYVIRGKPKDTAIFHLNSKSPDALILGDQFQLQARDVVYVETAGVTRWNRVISQILPTAQTLSTTSNVGQ